MRIAVDVCVGRRGTRLLRAAGHDVVVVAEHGEPDREWFARAIAAGAEVVISPDRDLSILCYDHRVRLIRPRCDLRGVTIATVALQKIAKWSAP